MSTDPESRDNYGPYLPNIGCICPSTKRPILYNDIPSLEEALEAHGKVTAAFIVEPIQGEAGVVVPDDDYLTKAKALCEKHNVLLICDEIQTGIARSGRMLCSEWSNIKPDMVTLGKAISGGMYPVSCVLGSKEVMLTIEPGTHGSTYGGNPLGCAVSIRALEIVEEENLVANAERLGNFFRQGLRDLNSPMIKTVRGRGLLNAIVIDEAHTGGHSAWDLCMLLKSKGLLVGRCVHVGHGNRPSAHEREVSAESKDTNFSSEDGVSGPIDSIEEETGQLMNGQAKPTHENIIRLAPPLVITEEQITEALRIIKEGIQELPGLKGEQMETVVPKSEQGVKIGLDD